MKSRADHATSTRIADVAYVESMHAVVVRFVNGRVYAVPLAELEGSDGSAATMVSVGSDGHAVVIEQRSGNRLDVPWDVILYHAEPEYPFYKHGAKVTNAASSRQEIGERIRFERLRRQWTLADLCVRTGIRIPNLSRLENGRHSPSLETLERVAGAFDLPVAALVSARHAAPVGS